MNLRPFLGLAGVLVAALTADFNDTVTSVALVDVRGGLGISSDPGTWLASLYATGQVFGMAIAPWCAVTFTVRRWVLFALGLCCVTSLAIPATSILSLLYVLRLLQGMSGGLIIPCLLIVGLRVLPPPIRLYGLAAYALTATFGPNMSTTLAALWTDLVWWPFAFIVALPLCAGAAVLVWFGVEQDPPQYARFRQFDLAGAILLVIGFGAFTTLLEQGDRYDWFNSQTICVLALVSAVAVPAFLLNELRQPVPLFGLFLLRRRNIAYGLVALFTFILLDLSASTLPVMFLSDIAGFRPVQSHWVTFAVAVAQMAMLPAIAFVLDFESVDARAVSFLGMACILAACIGNYYVTSVWQDGNFLPWQVLQALGQPMIIMPLLMMTTNAIRKPEEGPFASALVNTCRALAEPVGTWLVQLIVRWRGALHYDRIVDQSGQGRFRVVQGPDVVSGNPPPLLADGHQRVPGSLAGFMAEVQRQAMVLTLSDAFLIIATLVVFLMAVLLVLPERSAPPRIALARK